MKRADKLFDPRYIWPFILVTALFLFWGIPNNLNDVLIRQFMKSFEIDRLKAGLVQSAFYMGYFIIPIPAAAFMRKYGYKAGLLFGMLMFSSGTILFWPSAIIGKYIFFLGALFIIASGLAFLELGANVFIVELGDHHSAARRLNFSQAFNPIGSVLGVLIGTLFIFSGIEPDEKAAAAMKVAGQYEGFLRSEIMRVVDPYLVLGVVVFIWAILMSRAKFPKVEISELEESKGDYRKVLKNPHFIKAVISQFLYNGAQVGTWSFFIQYVQDYTGQGEKVAGLMLTGTLIAFGAGRFSATYLMKYIHPSKLMGIYGVINAALVSVGILFPGWIGVGCIFATSFFMSLMYPTNFALGVKGLGNLTKTGGSVLVMSIVGGAVFPPLMGLMAEKTGMAIAMSLPLICYIYITYFAFDNLNGSSE
ncbi:MAG: L-fucose:H+ symporter permease [Mangrovibacterium sp.]